MLTFAATGRFAAMASFVFVVWFLWRCTWRMP